MIAVSVIGLLVSVTVAVLAGVAVIGAHRVAQSAADLASLAGAAALQDGHDACRSAAEIARRNSARLTGCRVEQWNVSVVVDRDVGLAVARVGLRARARAGPVSTAQP